MRKLFSILFIICVLQATAQQKLSEQVAATVMTTWKDSLPIGGTTKWSYDMGVILKGFEGIWQRTGDKKYYNTIQSKMDWFVQSDGSIKGYEADELNLDHINNGKLVLLLYRVTQKEKYLKAANTLRDQLRHHPRTNEGGFWHKKVYPYQMWLDGIYMGDVFSMQYAAAFNQPQWFDEGAHQIKLMYQHAYDPATGLLFHGWDEF